MEEQGVEHSGQRETSMCEGGTELGRNQKKLGME